MDVNTVNSLCSDTSTWRRRVQEADPPPKTPWEDLPLFNCNRGGAQVWERSDALGHRILVASGVMPLSSPGISVITSDQTSPEIK